MKQVIVMGVLLSVAVLFGELLQPSVNATPVAGMPPIAWRRLIGAPDASLGFTLGNMPVAEHGHFVYDQSMNVEHYADAAVSGIAAAIGEPARARMLYCLVDGRARTSTELAVVAAVTPSTASVHLQRLKTQRLVKVLAQGKHRYYSLEGANVAAALEALSVLAGGTRAAFVPNTPNRLRAARTCYDHIAGTLGVSLHDRFQTLGWLSGDSTTSENARDLTSRGIREFETLGIDVDAIRALRRRFAYACVDWSERRPHLGGALGAALLNVALKRRWILQDLDSRALGVTNLGRREMMNRFGLQV
jgi:DNA-binding transcriptional ArsR family regulator